MSRILDGGWVGNYIIYTKNVESPESFHVWVAISTIASALQRKVSVKFTGKHVEIFPNLFIVLTAPPGICRKGTIINVGLRLLQKLEGPYIIANDITREKILREMKEHMFTEMGMPKPGDLYMHCSVTCIAEEFITLLGVHNIDLLGTMTALWNCDPEYTYSTKGAGEDKIVHPFLNILAGTTPQWLAASLPPEAIGGGFTSRILFVVEYDSDRIISLTDRTLTFDAEKERGLMLDLASIFRLQGEMLVPPEVDEWYTHWYRNFKTGKRTIEDDRFQAYYERKQVMLWKVAMCLSASEDDSMKIEIRHMEASRDLLDNLEDNMPKAFGGLGRSESSDLMERIKEYLIASGTGLTMKQLMSLMWHYVEDVRQLQNLISNWRTMGKIEVEEEAGRGTIWKWVD